MGVARRRRPEVKKILAEQARRRAPLNRARNVCRLLGGNVGVDERRDRSKAGWLYLFRETDAGDNCLFYVGITANPKAREAQYLGCNGHKKDWLWIETPNVTAVEAAIKLLLKDYSIPGTREIFSSSDRVLEVYDAIAQRGRDCFGVAHYLLGEVADIVESLGGWERERAA